MGEYHRSLFAQQPSSSQSPDFDSTIAPVIDSAGNKTCAFNTISSQRGSPMYVFPRLPNSRIDQFDQSQGWFYCLPRFRQAFTPGPIYSALKKKLPISCGSSDLNDEKKFLVFDQSGDQTTVMVSSGPGTPFRCMSSWTLRQPRQPYMDGEVYGAKPGSFPTSEPIPENDHDGNYEDADVSSEMHEDTEELNALLYSDDEGETYYSEEDDEITSTGHSPSTMTACEMPDRFHKEDKEEVASSASPRKRKWKENYVEALIDDTASSSNINGQSNYLSDDDDAESKCEEPKNLGFHEMGLSSSGSKRMRKEKIRETMGLLQEMIPDGKGKDALTVLDEAIDFLKSLKVRAQALGLAAL